MSRSSRKWEHIKHALATGQSGKQGFDDIMFIPNSLPNICYVNIDLQTNLAGFALSSPILINAMTGGSEQTAEINRKLAVIAREKGLAMAVGSQMAALREPRHAYSYQVVRETNPDGIIFANLGAECTLEQARQAVAMIDANALQIHLNVMQELLMPEGDRDFCGYLDNIERIASRLDVPVIVKEVGFGMSRTTIGALVGAGADAIDVGGAGGTNFAKIENRRSPHPLHMFDEWGLSTAQSLLEASEIERGAAEVIASGGIRNGLDVVKSLALGATAVGMAGTFLRFVQTLDPQASLDEVDQLHHQIKVAMTALGAENLEQLRKVSFVVKGHTAAWAQLRGIDLQKYALRQERQR